MTTAQPPSVEALLQAMVRLNTVNRVASGDPHTETKLADYNEAIAQAFGLQTRRLPIPGRSDNLLVVCAVDDRRPWLMFESHLDTVSTEGMSIDPWGGEIHDGRLWGRGSCDTKGSGAAMLWALGQYARASRRPNNIAIAFTIDEEYGMAGVRCLIESMPTLGFRPRGVIVGEPTQLVPIVAHNGLVRWRISTQGVAAHSSNPAHGRSAISDMVKVIQAIETHYVPHLRASDPLTGKAQCSINLIQGGQQINIIPDHCHIAIDRRVAPGEESSRIMAVVQDLLEGLLVSDPGLQFKQEPLFACPPLGRTHNGPLLTFVQGVLSKLGLPTQEAGAAYATDAGDMDAVGMPALVIGPGNIAQAHTKDEYLALEQLHRGVELYRAMMDAEW